MEMKLECQERKPVLTIHKECHKYPGVTMLEFSKDGKHGEENYFVEGKEPTIQELEDFISKVEKHKDSKSGKEYDKMSKDILEMKAALSYMKNKKFDDEDLPKIEREMFEMKRNQYIESKTAKDLIVCRMQIETLEKQDSFMKEHEENLIALIKFDGGEVPMIEKEIEINSNDTLEDTISSYEKLRDSKIEDTKDLDKMILNLKVGLGFHRLKEFNTIVAPKIRFDIEEIDKNRIEGFRISSDIKIVRKKRELIRRNIILMKNLEESLISLYEIES